MERRVLLAITLSFLVLFLFQRFVMPPPAPVPSAPAATLESDTPAAPARSAPVHRGTRAPAAPERTSGAAGTRYRRDRERSECSRDRRRDDQGQSGLLESRRDARALDPEGVPHRRGQPLDLVPGGAGADAIKPFTLTVDDQAISARMNDAIYRVTVNGAPAGEMVDATASPQTIVFETASADGLNVKKTFAVEPTSYIVSFGAVVEMGEQRQNPVIHWGPGLGDDIARAQAGVVLLAELQHAGAADHLQGRQRRAHRADGERHRKKAPFRYAGIDDHYFVSMLLNDQNTQPVRVDYAPDDVPQPDDPAIIGHYVDYSVRFQAPQDQSRFFFGPKAFDGSARDQPRSDQGDQLRHVLVAGGAAAERAEVGARLHRQLGLGDHRPDAADQHWRCSRCATRAWSRCARCRRSSRR